MKERERREKDTGIDKWPPCNKSNSQHH